MSRVEDLEREIQELSPRELSSFRSWFYEFDAEVWDRQIEEDVRAGKLDSLADAALEALKAGSCSEI